MDFRLNGYSYKLIVRPWLKGQRRNEAIRWVSGLRRQWERISYDDYLKAKSEANG
jgi:hypothetical protein